MVTIIILTALSFGLWVFLLLFRGRFWQADCRLDEPADQPSAWPEVVAILPARDEASVIGASVASHAASAYPGRFQVILVDDGSRDGTAETARAAFEVARREAPSEERRLHIVTAPPLAEGWTGKLAAQAAGFAASHEIAPQARYVLLTDADIVHGSRVLSKLVSKAETEGRSMVSLMARLDARGFWGGLLIPAFVFFFQKLYPFPRVNDPKDSMAGAAGGCMLVDRAALEEEGGFEAIRGSLIDDCALARLVKGRPPKRSIWLGLTEEVISQRDNRALSSIWTMVSRTAYAQLSNSPFLLLGTVVGMAILYLAGPLALLTWPLHGTVEAANLGVVTWGLMVIAYRPTLRLYGRSLWAAFALPFAALLYTAMTVGSAWAHWRGRGGAWKGRTYSKL